MSKEKICPIMAQGFISGYMSNAYNEKIDDYEEAIRKLPKCLEEKCALWIEECLGRTGRCGLIKKG